MKKNNWILYILLVCMVGYLLYRITPTKPQTISEVKTIDRSDEIKQLKNTIHQQRGRIDSLLRVKTNIKTIVDEKIRGIEQSPIIYNTSLLDSMLGHNMHSGLIVINNDSFFKLSATDIKLVNATFISNAGRGEQIMVMDSMLSAYDSIYINMDSIIQLQQLTIDNRDSIISQLKGNNRRVKILAGASMVVATIIVLIR